MDGESLLYIILAIIYFVVSIMGSSKKAKKKREQQRRAAEQQEAGEYPEGVPGEGGERRPTFQEMMETLLEEERPSKPKVPEAPEVPEMSEAAQMELERQEALARRMREAESRRQKQQDFERKLRTDMPAMALKTMRKTRKAGKLFEGVSARQAVIAREILDRRYT